MSSLPEFLVPLETFRRPFPRQAMEEAIAQREESTPHLIEALEKVVRDPEEFLGTDYMLYEYAMFILAQFREERAYRPMVALARHPLVEELISDTITMGLPGILASVCDGDYEPIYSLVEDHKANEFARSAGISALQLRCEAGLLSREDLSRYFGELFASRLEREPGYVWHSLCNACGELKMIEHIESIRAAYSDELADQFGFPLSDVEKEIVLPAGQLLYAGGYRERMINDAIAEMEGWHCFTEEAAEEERCAALEDGDVFLDFESLDGEASPLAGTELNLLSSEFNATALPKIGRNEPCPCGSGKKYKKCCGLHSGF